MKSTNRYSEKSWYFLRTFTYEGKLEVYMDGVHLKSIGADFTLPAGGDAYYYGRLVEGGFDFPGKITEGELLDEVLTPEQIKDRYESHLVVPEPEGGIKITTPLITLLPGESAELGIVAYGNTTLKLTAVGDAATVKDGRVTAEKVGETLIYAVSEDGRYIGGAVVLVVESIPEDTTEPDTDAPDEPADTNASSTPPDDTEGEDLNPDENTSDENTSGENGTEEEKPKGGCKSSIASTGPMLLVLLPGGCWISRKRGSRSR